MNIFITGSEGFIGKALYTEIKKTYGNILLVDDIYGTPEWQRRLLNFLSEPLLPTLKPFKPDVVFHVGAAESPNIKEMMIKNVESTFLIADFCKAQNLPLIFSSCYCAENPASEFAWTKFIGEKYVVACGGIALRYFAVYGFGESRKKIPSIPYQFYKKNLLGEKVTLSSSRVCSCDFVYIEDVISANIHAWKNYQELKGGVYDVGAAQLKSYREVAELLEVRNIITGWAEPYQTTPKANENKFMAGWKPEWSLIQGLVDYKQKLLIS